jgi:hypothetical protein
METISSEDSRTKPEGNEYTGIVEPAEKEIYGESH